jgi:hypothetical protein
MSERTVKTQLGKKGPIGNDLGRKLFACHQHTNGNRKIE